jgi:flagellar hook-length control protein FliK
MTISLIPVAVADPPAPSSAAPASRGGPSFGQFIDNADAQASDNAMRARQNAPSDRRRDNNPSSSTDKTSDRPAPQAATQAPAASADQPSDKAADRPPSADHMPSSAGGKQGKRASGGDGQPSGDKVDQPADAPVVAAPVALAPAVPPIASSIVNVPTASNPLPAGTDKVALPGVTAVKTDAGATGLSVLIGSHGKGQGPWQATAAAASAKADANPAPVAATTAGTTAPTAAQQGDLEAAVKAAATTPAVATAPVLAPPVAGTTTPAPTLSAGATPPVGGPANHRGIVSAQAAALLNRLTSNAATQSQASATATAIAPVTGAAAASGAAATARSAIAPAPAPAAAPSDAAPAPAAPATGTAAQGTPLPPVSAAVDLSAKFSATALAEHGEVAAAAGKAKTDTHAVTSPAAPAASRPTVSPATATANAESAAAASAAKPAADAPLAGAAVANSDMASDDDAVAAPTASSSTVGPQQRGDIAAPPNGTAPIVRAQEAAAAPLAALHSVTEQVAISLKRGVKDGNDQIQINLEPASLGKIAVRLDFAQDGRVTATFSADRPDTLNLLNQDSRALEQSLRDAGLRADSSSLSFNLSGGDNGANARQFAQSASYAATAATMADNDPLAPLAAAPAIANGLSHDGGLDIHV